MFLKTALKELACGKAPGPAPSFTVLHVVKMLELTAARSPIGRNKLSKELKLGEGTVRTMIKRLKENGLITTLKGGCVLTDKGRKVWAAYSKIFPRKVRLERNELTLSNCNIAVLIKNLGDKVAGGMEQRDAAIIAGAKTATTLVMKNGKLTVPFVSEDVAKDFPLAYKQIITSLKPEDRDAIIISGADNWEKAEYGALAASMVFLEKNCS